MAFVRSVTSLEHRSTEGMNPSSGKECSGMGLMPSMVKLILSAGRVMFQNSAQREILTYWWLKYLQTFALNFKTICEEEIHTKAREG